MLSFQDAKILQIQLPKALPWASIYQAFSLKKIVYSPAEPPPRDSAIFLSLRLRRKPKERGLFY